MSLNWNAFQPGVSMYDNASVDHDSTEAQVFSIDADFSLTYMKNRNYKKRIPNGMAVQQWISNRIDPLLNKTIQELENARVDGL